MKWVKHVIFPISKKICANFLRLKFFIVGISHGSVDFTVPCCHSFYKRLKCLLC